MALQGTIKDFGLADIFQLIGMQRRTGILTLDNGRDTVTVQFLEGQVVGADTRLRNLEDLLGGVLVRTGRITEEQLQKALQIQKKTLQRLGYILVKQKFISEEDLREALQVQVTQIIYRLFRWKEGTYRFTVTDNLDYDREHFIPVSAETILMEGARMVDEWPIIERKIRSHNMVFRKSAAARKLDAPVRSIVDEDIDLQEDRSGERAEDSIQLSPEERNILRLVNGKYTVQEIVDRSPMGEFDVYRTLYELLNRHLIEEVPRVTAAAASASRGRLLRAAAWICLVCLFGLAGVSVGTLRANPWLPWRLGMEKPTTERLRYFVTRERFQRLERGIRVFYLDQARMPQRLDELAEGGYLRSEDLRDAWGRPFALELGSGGYRLAAADPPGEVGPPLETVQRFDPAQRMVLENLGDLPASPESRRP